MNFSLSESFLFFFFFLPEDMAELLPYLDGGSDWILM